MSNFHLGQKVVCIDPEPCPGTRWCRGEAPKKGAVYTIGRLFFDDAKIGGWTVHLEELKRTKAAAKEWRFPDIGYGAFRFRPVKTTDISIFTAILAPTPRVKERA